MVRNICSILKALKIQYRRTTLRQNDNNTDEQNLKLFKGGRRNDHHNEAAEKLFWKSMKICGSDFSGLKY